jgi:mannose-1-phosphate guanylyltransferase / phosphomannomutase
VGDIKCAILAAGLGKRMDPLTARHLPKPLFPLGGKLPMAEVWVRRMVKSGITDISMNLCVLGDLIKRHFRDGLKFGANLTYTEEEVPSGTLGGVCKQALGRESKRVCSRGNHPKSESFKGSTLIVPSGDIVTNFGADLLEEMYDIHKKAGAAFTMVLVPVPWERRRDYGTAILGNPEARSGIVSKSGRIINFVEKDADSPSNLSNASIYMIEMDLLRALDPLRTEAAPDIAHPFYDFGKHVFPALLGRSRDFSFQREFPLWGIEYDGSWFDVGQKRDYLKVNEYLLDKKLDVPLGYEELPWGYLGTSVSIAFSKVTIVPPVVIGNNCVIEPGATLGPYAIIGDDWRIQNRVHISHSVLWERYAYFDEEGNEVPPDLRRLIDRHEVRKGVTIEHSIVAGGDIQSDLRDKTVDVQSDGHLGILDIDWVAAGPRA